MLGYMRKHSQSFIIYLLFAALIVVFAFSFGPGSGKGCGVNTDFAAMVNGERITDKEFIRRYSDVFQYWQRRSPEYFNAEQASKLNLRKRVIDQMINERLMAQQAEERGLVITDTELQESIMNNPTFMTEGKFDYTAYEAYVTQYRGMSIPRFEMKMRKELLYQKLRDLILVGVQVSEQELMTEYKIQNDKIKVNFVRFDPARYGESQQITKEDAEKILAEKEAQVRRYFERELYRYREPRQVLMRRILIKADDNDQAAQQAAQEKLAQLKEQIDQGKDFAELAKTNSQGPKAKEGGLLGWIGKDPTIPQRALLQASYAMQAGQVSQEPIKNAEGYNLLKIEQIKDATQKPFDEIKVQVATDYLKFERGAEMAKNQATQWLQSLKAGKSVASMTTKKPDERSVLAKMPAPANKPYLESTDWITKDVQALPRIGINDKLKADIFKLNAEHKFVDTVYQVGRHFYVVWMAEREEPDMTLFDTNKESLRNSLLSRKSNYVISSWLKNVRENSTIEVNNALIAYNAAQDAS